MKENWGASLAPGGEKRPAGAAFELERGGMEDGGGGRRGGRRGESERGTEGKRRKRGRERRRGEREIESGTYIRMMRWKDA